MKNRIVVIDFETLYYNCIYSSIAHAISNLKDPFFSYTQSWDGNNYCFHDGSERGTISFDLSEHILSGAAREETSMRIKWYPNYKAISLYEGAPTKVKFLAQNETLEYLYDEKDGIVQPMATVAFWNDGNEIYTNDDNQLFITNGGEYIVNIAVSHEELKEYWKKEYDLKHEELAAIDYIFVHFKENKKIKFKDISIINKHCDGYNECLESLNELGIHIE